MSVKYNKNLFIINAVLLAQYFFSIEFFLAILVVIIVVEAILNHGKLKLNKMACEKEYIAFMALGIVIGGVNFLCGSCTVRHYIKDILYMTLMVIFWTIGSNLYTGTDKHSLKRDVFLAGTLLATVDFINCAWKILGNNGMDGSLYELRSLIGTGGPTAMITLFWCVYFYKNIQMKKCYKNLCVGILVADICIHFSRMNILIAFVFVVYSGLIKKPTKLLKCLAIVLLAILAMSIISPDMLLMYVNKIFNSVKEISFATKTWDKTTIVQNWRGYEVYCEINKFTKESLFGKLLGDGFGAQLDVGGYAYLISTEETIPFLHNGYFTILMIWGAIGVIAYLSMLISLFKNGGTQKLRREDFGKLLLC